MTTELPGDCLHPVDGDPLFGYTSRRMSRRRPSSSAGSAPPRRAVWNWPWRSRGTRSSSLPIRVTNPLFVMAGPIRLASLRALAGFGAGTPGQFSFKHLLPGFPHQILIVGHPDLSRSGWGHAS